MADSPPSDKLGRSFAHRFVGGRHTFRSGMLSGGGRAVPSDALRRLVIPHSNASAVDEQVPEVSRDKTLASLRDAFSSLARQASALALEGRYSVIIGDDTSGRIPARILHATLNRYLIAQKADPLPIVFWQSDSTGSREMREALKAREPLLEAMNARQGRALIVTEYISSGKHVRRMIEMLNKIGIDADVATVGLNRERLSYEGGVGVPLIDGGIDDPYVHGLYQASRLSGMSRVKYDSRPVLRNPNVRKTMIRARADVKALSHNLAREL